MKKYNIVIFYRDLRVQDNLALKAALEAKLPCLALYVFDDSSKASYRYGSSQKEWLMHSLASLKGDLEQFNIPLSFFKGGFKSIIEKVCRDLGEPSVFFLNDSYDLEAEKRKSILQKLTYSFEVFPGALLYNLDAILTSSASHYKVFTPFWRESLRKTPPYQEVLHKPRKVKLPDPPKVSGGDSLPQLLIKESVVSPGEKEAWKKLRTFTKAALSTYPEGRDFPVMEGTSKLSPHLAFGELSPYRVWSAVNSWVEECEDPELIIAAEKFMSEIGWREFAYYLLRHFPHIASKPFVEKFKNFPWESNSEFLGCWKEGKTGFPIVDAGMRELKETYWMHNRVRMITASFLVKDLLIHWKEGEAWFWDLLVDADPAVNVCSWQWVAGSGADAAPFFRIFNPETQSKKFDPEGEYIRRWIPELRGLPNRYIHSPSSAPDRVLREAGVIIGEDYPTPLVDHSEARKRALELFKNL